MPVVREAGVILLMNSAKYTVHTYKLIFECMLLDSSLLLLCDGRVKSL